MTDCYRILGVSRQASPAEIRVAYLARMKERHPDARRDGGDARGGDAGDITFAYWQLRDAERRAEHDRLVFADLAPKPPRRRRATRTRPAVPAPLPRPTPPRVTARPKISTRRLARRAKGLQPFRTAAGIAFCTVAATAFTIAFTSLDRGTAPAQAQAQHQTVRATALAAAPEATTAAPARRRHDPALISAAGDAFRETIRNSGPDGARRYARQCLLELTARPTMTMLDFCVAFDDRAADWEMSRGIVAGASGGDRYFTEAQRFGRYRSAAAGIRAHEIRDALDAEVQFFADAAR